MSIRESRDGAHDFDFLHGRWRVHNKRLRRPLSGLAEWYTFEGATEERSLWNGQANIEEYVAEQPAGLLRGLALRLYNPGRANGAFIGRTAAPARSTRR